MSQRKCSKLADAAAELQPKGKSIVDADEAGSDSAERDRRNETVSSVLADFDARGVGLRMSENLPRDSLYDRDAP